MSTLYAIQTKAGEYSRIYTDLEALKSWIAEYGVVGIIGIVVFEPVCETKVQVEIPWEEGIAQLIARRGITGASEDQSPDDASSVREETTGDARKNQGRNKKRSRGVQSRNGVSSSE